MSNFNFCEVPANLNEQVAQSIAKMEEYRSTPARLPCLSVICLDTSGSMNRKTDGTTAIQLASQCLRQFKGDVSRDPAMKPFLEGGFQTALLTFNQTPKLEQYFSPIQNLHCASFRANYTTYMGDALCEALSLLNTEETAVRKTCKKIIFLITDGYNTTDNAANVQHLNQFKKMALSSGVLVIPIGIGSEVNAKELGEKVSTCKDNQVLLFERANSETFSGLSRILSASVRKVSTHRNASVHQMDISAALPKGCKVVTCTAL